MWAWRATRVVGMGMKKVFVAKRRAADSWYLLL
jgi:hypothetical protein